MSDYYNRTGKTGPDDGIPVFATDLDNKLEGDVAARLEQAWGVTVHKLGRLTAIDAYAMRRGHLVALIEIKNRHHPRDKYPTVLLNLRKWLALVQSKAGMGCSAIFAVGFSDGHVGWIHAWNVAGAEIKLTGTTHVVKSHTDREPCFFIPVDAFNWLEPPAPGEE